MRKISLVMATAGVLMVAGCGGGNDDMASTPPPTANPPPTTPVTTDFNGFAIALVKQPDAEADKKAPATVEDQTFTFSEDGTALTALLPTS